jgi:hypothetical protein
MFRTIMFSMLALAATVFPDASVVQSGSPTFPLQVDKVALTVVCGGGKNLVSRTVGLPLSMYEELRGNIDTIFTYADALRNRRPELAGCEHAPILTFEYMGIPVMRVVFPCEARTARNPYTRARLSAAEDRYPFVVVLTRGFSVRLKKLAPKK